MSKPCVFGARLRAALTDADMTQAELARRLNYSEPQISRWMAGDREPRLSDLVRIAEILGRPLDYFVGMEVRKNV